MSIAHELSSEIAAAVLAGEEGEASRDPSERIELVLEVHSTLRRLSAEHRRMSRAAKDGRVETTLAEGAAPGQRSLT